MSPERAAEIKTILLTHPKLVFVSARPEIETDIAEAIRLAAERWVAENDLDSVMKINMGYCYDFANELQDHYGGVRLDFEDCSHGWLYWNGKHYDSESPEGEVNWVQLQTFQRWGMDKMIASGYIGTQGELMLALSTLRKRAQRSTKFRGHRMTWAHALEPSPGKFTRRGMCLDCSMTVMLRTHPAPNEINIGGEAVALNCPGKRKLKG